MMYKCCFCKQLIENNAIELSQNKGKKTSVKRSHEKCLEEHKQTVYEHNLLFDYIRDTYFVINFPTYIAISLTNLHNIGSRYKNINTSNHGYPYIVIYNAAKCAEKELKNYIQYAEKENIIKDTQHKSNIILKGIEKYLENCYSDWMTAKCKKEETEIENMPSAEIKETYSIELPNRFKKLIDFGE